MKYRVLRSCACCAVVFLLMFVSVTPIAFAQNNVQGQWSTLSYLMPINPVHVALMYNGKVLVVSGSGNDPSNANLRAAVWDPIAGTITVQTVAWDMFCNGMVVLPDGRPLINGGTLQYDPFFGSKKSSVFDPTTNTFTDVQTMAHGRWYPTVTTLGDGRIMTFSGEDESGDTNTTVELYSVASGWSVPYNAGWTPPLYPRMHLLPNGKVFYSGSGTTSMLFDPSAHTWSTVAKTIYSGTRTYGSSVLLPLTPANNYDPKVMILGGSNGGAATATTEIIDLGAATPAWTSGPNMTQGRTEMNAVLLPNGKVLAVGGSVNDEDATSKSLNADLFDPTVPSVSSAGVNAYARLYHSNALLLPDATVWFTGGNPVRGTYEQHMEIYQPAYLFTSGGGLATRPTITSIPGTISWGTPFTVTTPDAANISSVVLMRPGAPTHAFDMDQRQVGMSFTKGSGTLTVTAPPNGNIAPPGYYMLFLLNGSGVPSVAKFTKLGAGAPAPTVSAISPTSGTTNGGTPVTITGTGFLAGATVKLGGASATGVTVVSSTSITATTAAHAAGAVSVVVTNTDTQSGTLTNGYTYTGVNPAPTVSSINPTSGTTGGGTPVTITGTGFLAGATVSLGGTAATGVTVVSSTSITATAPAHAVGAASVVVTNTDAQSGTLTNGYTYTTSTGGGPIAFVQVNSATPTGSTAAILLSYGLPQTAGNLNIVVVGWNDITSTVTSVSDSLGNTYAQAGTLVTGSAERQALYYAKNILAGSNVVTVTFNQAARIADVRILEYSGLDPNNPLDVTASAAGSSITPNSGTATTTSANELIFGAGTTATSFYAAGTGFTSRIFTGDGDIAEDQVVSSTGSYSATGKTSSAPWVMQMATFRAGQSSGNPAPTVSSINPTSGSANGGTPVTITGTGFLTGATVKIGGTAATGVTVVSSISITATAPAHAAGAASVVVTNTDAQNGTLTNGYTYTAVNPAPTVSSINPTSGSANGGTPVTITGTGFLAGATVKLGGTAATGVTVVSSISITATAPAHAAGAASVVVTNTDAQNGTLTNGYTYTAVNPAPTVSSINPTSGSANGGTPVTITGTGFLAGATVKIGGTAAIGVTVVSSISITATAPAHGAGAVSVVVTNTDAQSGTLTNGYTYTGVNPAPTVSSINPTSGTTGGGTPVTITGTGFLAGATVSLGGTAATGVTVVSSTSITATAPAHAAGAASVVVTNTDAQSGTLTNGYTYTTSTGGGPIAFVQVNSATPRTDGTSVPVTFVLPQTAGNLNIVVVGWNDITSTVTSVSDSLGNSYAQAGTLVTGSAERQALYFAKNIAAGSNTVTVTFNQAARIADVRILEYSGLDPNNPLDVTASAAGSSVTPNSGTATTTSANELIFGAGTTATSFYAAGTGFTSRIFTGDGDIAEDQVVSSTGSYSATGKTSSAPWVMQMATFRAGQSSGNPAPTVSSINPTSGSANGGTPVTITGTGFLAGATVKLGGTAATGVTVVNSTSITATTAAHAAGAVSVVVTNTDAQNGTLTNGYTYTAVNPAPTVSSINPTSGSANGGTPVTITGTGFLAGATVSLGGAAATGVTVVNSTSITATTAAHAAGAVSVVVTNTDAQNGTLTNGYTYTAVNPAPTVNSINPTSGSANGGTPVTITGTGFLAGATVSLGGTAATGVTVVNSTSITATTAAHAAGAVSVVVTNTDTQNGTLTNGYTYTGVNPAPTVSAINPTSGTTGGGTPVTITGTGFLAGATVSLGGAAATGVTVVNSTSITATTAAHAAGAASVVVTNTDAQSGTLTNGYTYTTSTGGGPIAFVQVNAAIPQTNSASVPVTFGLAQTAGNLNIVVVGWNDITSTVTSVTDSLGNAYAQAGITVSGTAERQAIYYAKNILAGSNTVTATFNQAARFVDVRILEYSGLDPNNPLDVTASAAGNSVSPNSGTATTTSANELIFGAGTTATGFYAPGTGFTTRIITGDGDIAEDKVVSSTGSYSATAPTSSAPWVMQMATFRAKP